MIRLAHVINPVLVPPASDLFAAQPITFESIRRARQTAVKASIPLIVYTINFPEDDSLVPLDFTPLPHLNRSVQDIGQFDSSRKLPLLIDILTALYAGSEADYFIYTNVDIALQPNFYTAVTQFIHDGYDAFVINRRTIPNYYRQIEKLPDMYAEPGLAHRGWDCFVFPRSLVSQIDLGHICLGAPRIGLAFLANIIALAAHFREFKDEHLTFHIGDDRRWRGRQPSEFARHNFREADAILKRLVQSHGPFPRHTPVAAYLFKKRLFGPVYDAWVEWSDLPIGWSRRLNQGLSRLLSGRTKHA